MTRQVIIIGAGVGGLAAALELSARGLAVTVLDKEATPGGKMRQLFPAGRPVDAGPTVFTMRRVFDELFARVGTTLEAELSPIRLKILARHAWDLDGRREATLDLFADRSASQDAIAAFAGRSDAEGFERFCTDAARIFRTLDEPFMRAPPPGPIGLLSALGWRGLPDLLATRPFSTLWSALGSYFSDPRLRQLFGRYATYNGSNPFLAPATLMLIAHAELEGVWALEGGMHALAQALQRLAERQGATFRFNANVASIHPDSLGAHRVCLGTGEQLEADAIIFNGDVSALSSGLLGSETRSKIRSTPASKRSLSAITWCLDVPTSGFPLTRHNVFFSADYASEFREISAERRPPRWPTVYVCAQDRDDSASPQTSDRLLCLVNAPPDGDGTPLSDRLLEETERQTFALLQRCGLSIKGEKQAALTTTPEGFHRLFPATGGALYGPATHGGFSAFARAGARTAIPRLYLCGGSVHPSAGVPMAAQSGRLAAAAVIEDSR